jgi:Fe-S-cluster containining protein
MNRCTGHCCAAFPVGGLGPHDMARLRLAQDGDFIADMLVYIGPRADDGRHMWTCRHFDFSSGNCGAYDMRPRMCSEYPYGKTCEHAECTRDHVEPDPIPPGRLAWLARAQAASASAASASSGVE